MSIIQEVTNLGGVLSYCTAGIQRVMGQAVGADGAGQFTVLIQGTPQEAEDKARAYIQNLQARGHRINYVIFAANHPDWGNYGNPVSVMEKV